MHEPIDVYLPADPDDPRVPAPDPPGIRIHRGPPLHPDDLAVVDGIPVTSVSRTLIDLADVLGEQELRECFRNARERGLLDPEALHAARGRSDDRGVHTGVRRSAWTDPRLDDEKQIGFGLVGVLVAAMIALIAALVCGAHRLVSHGRRSVDVQEMATDGHFLAPHPLSRE